MSCAVIATARSGRQTGVGVAAKEDELATNLHHLTRRPRLRIRPRQAGEKGPRERDGIVAIQTAENLPCDTGRDWVTSRRWAQASDGLLDRTCGAPSAKQVEVST